MTYAILNPFTPCCPLGGSQCRPTFGQQNLENGMSKRYLYQHAFDRIFKISNDTQVDRIYTCGSVV